MKKWLKKNGGRRYFMGQDTMDRVRTWRQKHPFYWKRNRSQKNSTGGKLALTKELAEALRYVALQDTIDPQLALGIGIISEVSGVALQTSIAKEIRRLMLRGYDILRGQSVRPTKQSAAAR